MTKVPSLNYSEVTKAFERAGWELIRQKGSHMILAHGRRKIVIPAHKPIKTLDTREDPQAGRHLGR